MTSMMRVWESGNDKISWQDFIEAPETIKTIGNRTSVQEAALGQLIEI